MATAPRRRKRGGTISCRWANSFTNGARPLHLGLRLAIPTRPGSDRSKQELVELLYRYLPDEAARQAVLVDDPARLCGSRVKIAEDGCNSDVGDIIDNSNAATRADVVARWNELNRTGDPPALPGRQQ